MYENENFGGIKEGGNAMGAFALGMIAGAVTALLLAPASGSETRRKLGQVAQNVGSKAKEGFDASRQFVNDQKDRFTGAVEEGKQTYRKESSTTSSTL